MRRILVGVPLAVLIVPAGIADAAIVLGKSIHGVRIGMTKKQAQQHLGVGKPQYSGSNIFHYHGQKYLLIFTRGKVSAMSTTDPTQRTSRGFGFGTTFARLKKTPGFHCINTQGYNFEKDCTFGQTSHHHYYTLFEFGGGPTVIEVDIQRNGG